MRMTRGAGVLILALALGSATCQGPVSTTTVSVAFINSGTEDAAVSWGSSADGLESKPSEPIARCSVLRRGFGPGQYVVLVRAGKRQDVFTLQPGPSSGPERQDTIRIGPYTTTYAPGQTYASTGPVCPSHSP